MAAIYILQEARENREDVLGNVEMRELYENFLNASGKCEGTVKMRIRHLISLRKAKGELLKLTAQDLEEYLGVTLRMKSPNYRKSVRGSIQQFYRWATTRGLIQVDPAYALPAISIPRPLPRPVPEQELLFAYYQAEDEARAMIALASMAGLRLSEVTHLHMDNREGNVLRVMGKGSKERLVPLNETVLADLLAIENKGRYGYYFANPYRSYAPYSISYVADQIKKHLPKKYSAHSLRHRAASVAYGATKDIRAVQEFLGHANVNTTQIYTAVTSAALLAVGDATGFQTAA